MKKRKKFILILLLILIITLPVLPGKCNRKDWYNYHYFCELVKIEQESRDNWRWEVSYGLPVWCNDDIVNPVITFKWKTYKNSCNSCSDCNKYYLRSILWIIINLIKN